MSKKKRIANLERELARLSDLIEIIISQDPDDLARIENIERQIDDLEAMTRHYIARSEEQEKRRPLVAPIQPPPMPWQAPIISDAQRLTFTYYSGARPLPAAKRRAAAMASELAE